MDIALTDAETKYYNDLFNLCDSEKIGKIPKLKAEEFFRTAENIDNEILLEVSSCNVFLLLKYRTLYCQDLV